MKKKKINKNKKKKKKNKNEHSEGTNYSKEIFHYLSLHVNAVINMMITTTHIYQHYTAALYISTTLQFQGISKMQPTTQRSLLPV